MRFQLPRPHSRQLTVVASLLIAAIFSAQIDVSSAHARLMQPPSRASMWRKGYNTPADYSDNQGFCGGFLQQYNVNDGKCGICGDPYDASPRNHESPGGVYATGTLTETYRPGEDIDVEVDVTANHMGYFTFKLCANNNTAQDPTQECFEQAVLPVLPHFGPHYVLPSKSIGTYMLKLRLPDDVWCKQCILQWTYTCGNNWGTCEDGSGALGCGAQEMFRACSDISIEGSPVDHSNEIEGSTLGTPSTTTTKAPANPNSTTQTSTTSTTTTTQSTTTTTTSNSNGVYVDCYPTSDYEAVAGMTDYCMANCNNNPPFCPESHCVCIKADQV